MPEDTSSKAPEIAVPAAPDSNGSMCSVASFDTRIARAREASGNIWQERARKARLSELARSEYLLRWLQQEPSGPIGFRKLVQFAPLAFRAKAGAERAVLDLIRRGLIIEVPGRPRRLELTEKGRNTSPNVATYFPLESKPYLSPALRRRIVLEVASHIAAHVQPILRSGADADQMLEAILTLGRRKVRSDVRLLVRHIDQTRCFVCGLSNDGSFAPVKTCDPDHLHRVHLACFDEHSSREKARWNAIVTEALQDLRRQLDQFNQGRLLHSADADGVRAAREF